MISYMKGTIEEIHTDSIVLDHQGIGYQLIMPSIDLERISKSSAEVKIYTYFQVREDAFQLFGFLTKEEKQCFELLITVNGVGPKAAISILSVLPPNDLKFAIAAGDSKSISKAPGVGAKTAQRVILDLKDKISLEEMLDSTSDSISDEIPMNTGNDKNKNDAILALESLGYGSSEIFRAMSDIPNGGDLDTEGWIKEVLKRIGLNL